MGSRGKAGQDRLSWEGFEEDTHTQLSSTACQLPRTFPGNCQEAKAGLGLPLGLFGYVLGESRWQNQR